MKIKKLHINNFKSLVDFELNAPSSLSVFVGPNAAGKSNIFEALEFLDFQSKMNSNAVFDLFGGTDKVLNFNLKSKKISYELEEQTDEEIITTLYSFQKNITPDIAFQHKNHVSLFNTFHFSRIFIGKQDLKKIKTNGNQKLTISADNLEKVLKRLLINEVVKEELLEWLQVFIPEFENIQVHSDNISGSDTLLIKEKHSKKHFDKTLISDGTYNILALLTAVYQSESPQFLCIEEPENGLNPYVIKTLIEFFRNICEEKGHLIWLTTHSPTLVNALKTEEIVLVDKQQGVTKIKQFNNDFNIYNLTLDEAWLSNALGGGLPW